MKKLLRDVVCLTIVCSFFAFPCFGAEAQVDVRKDSGPSDGLTISGAIKDIKGRPLKAASVSIYLDGHKLELPDETTSSKSGKYEVELVIPRGTLPNAKLELEVSKPAYKNSGRLVVERVVKEREDEQGNPYYLAHQSFTLKRAITPAFWVATLILIGVYAIIAFEMMHRTLAAFLGASLLLIVTYTAGTFNPGYVILSFEDAMGAVDMNVVLLLMSMMIIVGILKKTGVFQWLAYKSYQTARGNVFILAFILMFVTAVLSAFLDNVTTMLLMIPVTIEIALTLKINPIGFLVPEAFASNVGGTATLIGDPPNIMIGSYAKLTFVDFTKNLGMICLICLIVSIIYFVYWYKKEYRGARVVDVGKMVSRLREEYKITNSTLLIQGGVILGITIFLFIIHGRLHMEPSIAAMTGAAMLMVVSRINIVEMLEKEIEWPTLIFFIMLFIIVAGAEETGLIQIIADWVKDLSKGSLEIAILMVLWVSALASAIIDNIPFTATMLPIVAYLNTVIPGAESGILWWSLALGACLGGNGTMIGASANVVTVGMAERAGYPISFMKYFKIAFIPMIISIILCSVWLLMVRI
jgi:Na+/H+ antiporter NhaD/arsenite permease-like protein